MVDVRALEASPLHQSRLSGVNKSRGRLDQLSPGDLEDLAPAWRALSAEGECEEPFFQPEWFAAFAKAFSREKDPYLLTTWDAQGSLSSILPLVESDVFFHGIPARTLRSLSNIHSCRFDMIHRGKDSSDQADSTWASLKHCAEWDVLEALDVPSGGAFEEIARFAKTDGFLVGTWPTRKSPFLSLSGNTDNPLQDCHRSKRLASDLKGKRKKLDKEGAVSFELDTGGHRVDEFFALEASGWKGRNGSAIALDPSLVHFYKEIARSTAERGYFRMYSLLLEGKPIAMHFGFYMGNSYFLPKIAFDEQFGKFSPGHILMQYVLGDITHLGAKKMDLLGPRVLWKCMWTNNVREHANWYIFRPSLKGKLLYGMSMRAAPLLRRLKYWIQGDPQEINLK